MVTQSSRLSPAVGALVALALGGCTTFTATAPRSPVPSAEPRVVSPAPSAEPGVLSPVPGAVPGGLSPGPTPPRPITTTSASASLLEQSRAEFNAGRYAAAAASIERALGIEPNNALLWIALGEIKLAEGDTEQAHVIANKALTLAGGDRSIENRAARLLAR